MSEMITFYSYKGGVGRTMALANVAVLLSKWGYKVLMVDWDLDAPGLEFYFKKYLNLGEVSKTKGVIDLLHYPSDGSAQQRKLTKWQDFCLEINLFESSVPLHFLTAGERSDDYFTKVRNLNLETFYSENEGGAFIEGLRNEWKQEYDYVLIDSRTGVTDIGGVCTVQLPDILVLLFTTNEQSLSGIVDIAKSVNLGRRELPYDRCNLLSIPIIGRFGQTEEFKISQAWLEHISDELKEIYSYWLPISTERLDFIDITKIPHIPYFSFGEKLPVIEQRTTDPQGIGYAYETLAALVADKLESVEQLMENRSEFIRKVQKQDVGVMFKASSLPDDNLEVGQILNGQYEILNITAHSKIIQARDIKSDRLVAIKLFDASIDVAEYFQSVLGELKHSNIGQVHSIIPKPLGLVMEWVEGASLADILTIDEKMPVTDVIKIGIELADTLDYVHQRGIIHRDIKPDNIILNNNNLPVLVGFDIVRAASQHTITGLVDHPIGTSAYMAPEQFCNPIEIGPATDMFALGLVLYEMLTHRKPYKWGSNLPLYQESHFPKPEQHEIPESLYNILCSLLNEKPGQRLTATELRDKLKSSLNSFGEEKSEIISIASKVSLERHVTFCAQGLSNITLGTKSETDTVQFLVNNLKIRTVGDYHILVNYNMPLWSSSRENLEINILIITRFGVFLLEVKDWQGRIDAYDDKWLINGKHPIENAVTAIDSKARILHSYFFDRDSKLRDKISIVGLAVLARGKKNFFNYSSYGDKRVVGLDPALIQAIYKPGDQLSDQDIQRIKEALYSEHEAKREVVIANYRIVRKLSSGNLFMAFEAININIDTQRVRIKRYHLDDISSTSMLSIENFKRSAMAVSRMGTHEHIVNTINFFPDIDRPDVFYEVTEFIKGERSDDIMAKCETAVSLAEQLDYIEPLCEALTHAHKHGVYHRNLNPETVFVFENGSVKLADFDFAKISGEGTVFEPGQNFAITPMTAPEININPSAASPASDIYSLGALWFFLASLPEKEPKLDTKKIDDLNLPETARKLMKKMLTMAVASRPQSAEEVMEQLKKLRKK